MRSVLRFLERKEHVLAFDAEPSTCKYRLTSAKYLGIAAFIHAETCTKRPLRLLDVGCGKGKLILYARSPHVEFTGIDMSGANLEDARRAGYQHTKQGNVNERLPFPDESFDIVLCHHVLEHLLAPERLIEEMRRVLRPGGILIGGVPMHTWWVRLLRISVVPLVLPRARRAAAIANFGHVQFFTLPSFLALFREFQIEDVRGFKFFSAARYLPFENWHWFYRINIWWGKRYPNLSPEVNVVGRKPALPGMAAARELVNRVMASGSLKTCDTNNMSHRNDASAEANVGIFVGEAPPAKKSMNHVWWDLAAFDHNPLIRTPKFGITQTAKHRKYPIRALRYWFMYQLIHQEHRERGHSLDICEVGVDRGQMRLFMESTSTDLGQHSWPPIRSWDAVDIRADDDLLRAYGYTDFIAGNVENPDFSLIRTYDVIIILHLLEHLYDPEAAFKKLVPFLRSGGITIGGHPVTAAMFAKRWERKIRKTARKFGHVSVFSVRRVKALAQDNRLSLELLTGAFFFRKSGSVLENYRWWIRLNLMFGAAFPGWPGEIYWAMRRGAE